MNHFCINIEQETLKNKDFRRVLFTTELSQLVLMCIPPKEEIGKEIHHLDQFIRVEKGRGEAIIDKVHHVLEDGSALVIPKGAEHNIVNTSPDQDLLLYTIYTPPEHKKDTIHHSKKEADNDKEDEFDGKTSL
jgi:mannose-6-phosphate isomerase-like protein (cupin superfamily)